MAKAKDYIVDIGKSEVTLMGQVIATFEAEDRSKVTYVRDNKKRARWVKIALKNAPQLGDIRKESLEDGDKGITWEEVELVAEHEADFYDLFPSAPRPYLNKVGREHKEIFDWVIKNYPNFELQLYPAGAYDEVEAGVKGNLTIYPANPNKSTPENPTKIN